MRHSLSLTLILLLSLFASLAPAARPLAAQGCSDDAEVVEQVLEPDTQPMAPETPFMLSWTLRNSGDCTWSRTYRLVFTSGERMDGPRTVRLRSAVEPGESMTFELELTAPSDPQTYESTWQLRNADGDYFGPELTLSLQVDASEVSTTDVVLPEVLVFGGMGAGDDLYAISNCVIDGALPEEPTVVVDRSNLQYMHATIYLCSLPEGAEVTVEVTDPEGNTFQRDYVQDAPVTGKDFDENEYTGTFEEVFLAWLSQAPTGEWVVNITGDELIAQESIEVVELPDIVDDITYPTLDNWPTAPIDPFAAAAGCHYNYTPGQEMIISGSALSPNTTLQLGFYQERFGTGYLAGQEPIETDADGAFTIPYHAFDEPGSYNVVTIESVDPEAYNEDGVQYDTGMADESSGFTCFTVIDTTTEESDIPLRLALAAGELNQSEIYVYDVATGEAYFTTFTNGNCDTSEPAWWPGGEWVIYQSNCIADTSGEFPEMYLADNYDLYASQVDPTNSLPIEETLIRLTDTPEINETEPDANLDGIIVYRQTALDASLDESGELWLLDNNDGSTVSLGLWGRAPAWSPDGTRIAFMSDNEGVNESEGENDNEGDGGGNWQIYVYDLEDEELSLVSEGCETQCQMPAWSPDAKQIIYQRSDSLDDPTPAGLWIATLSGLRRPQRYLEGAYGRPTWSSTGWIAFQGAKGIYRAKEGRRPEPELYLYGDPDWAVFWSPVWSR